METNFTAAWRSKRFNPAGESPFSSPAAVALKTNFNAIADEDALGDAISVALDATLQGIDVACYYLAKTKANKESGPINVTGMFVELFGPGAGQAIVNTYLGFDPQGDSEQKTSIGIGHDWVCPFCEYGVDKSGKQVLKIGTIKRNAAGQYAGLKVTYKFPLPAVDLTRKR